MDVGKDVPLLGVDIFVDPVLFHDCSSAGVLSFFDIEDEEVYVAYSATWLIQSA